MVKSGSKVELYDQKPANKTRKKIEKIKTVIKKRIKRTHFYEYFKEMYFFVRSPIVKFVYHQVSN